MIVQSTYRMNAFGKFKIKITEQTNLMRAYKLRNHIIGFVDDKVAI